MKVFLKDFLYGILVVIVITVFEFLVTLPFGDPWELRPVEYFRYINRELLLTALPAGIVTFMFAWILKTEGKSGALRRALVWSIVIFLNYMIIGIGNNNFWEIFGTIGIYVLLICAYLGPIVYAKIKKLQ